MCGRTCVALVVLFLPLRSAGFADHVRHHHHRHHRHRSNGRFAFGIWNLIHHGQSASLASIYIHDMCPPLPSLSFPSPPHATLRPAGRQAGSQAEKHAAHDDSFCHFVMMVSLLMVALGCVCAITPYTHVPLTYYMYEVCVRCRQSPRRGARWKTGRKGEMHVATPSSLLRRCGSTSQWPTRLLARWTGR
ncbi:hypothetical protein HDK77DRAFT_46828 [Phyllosticta capitalensis]